MTVNVTEIYTIRGFVLLGELAEAHPQLQGEAPPQLISIRVVDLADDSEHDERLELISTELLAHGCAVLYYAPEELDAVKLLELEQVWLARVRGSSAQRELLLTEEIKRQRDANTELRSRLESAALDTRRAYAEVWSTATRNEISALDFTPDRLRAELRSRWLERRVLADGTVPAVGQRVVVVPVHRGRSHVHDDKVHEITSLLGGDCHLVECGPEQLSVSELRLAPEGSDVTCPHCRGWAEQREKWRIDDQVYRETQFKVEKLKKKAKDAVEAARTRETQLLDEIDLLREAMGEARDCAAADGAGAADILDAALRKKVEAV